MAVLEFAASNGSAGNQVDMFVYLYVIIVVAMSRRRYLTL